MKINEAIPPALHRDLKTEPFVLEVFLFIIQILSISSSDGIITYIVMLILVIAAQRGRVRLGVLASHAAS
jgi:hypothetical protein